MQRGYNIRVNHHPDAWLTRTDCFVALDSFRFDDSKNLVLRQDDFEEQEFFRVAVQKSASFVRQA
jgi:hypothetical protein